jgi:hypothetical protein
MKRFIFQILIFALFICIVIVWICSRADGFTDPFYVRFTTPKQKNMIIGTSRAAQGLHPEVFNKIINKEFYNYAFTLLHSPFGSTYYESIKKKLKPNVTDGVFIISVNPWSISSWSINPNDSLSFSELTLCLANTKVVNMNPNPIYLINNWNDKYYKILTKKPTNIFLHQDGWLEVLIDMDSTKVQNRIENKERIYRENNLPNTKFSKIRYKYLVKIINFLNDHGKVYLVRLPIHPKIMEIEKELMPDFKNKIQNAINISSGYLDLTTQNSNYRYTDGNHLYKDSGELVSEIIANWINNR